VGFRQLAPHHSVSVHATLKAFTGADVRCSWFEWYRRHVSDVVVGASAGLPLGKLASVCCLSCICVWLMWIFVQVLL
jgi:hypothetical protein